MAPHSSTLAWKIPWVEEPCGLQSMVLLRVGHDWLYFHFSLSCIGEGNSNPLQCSCLGNPRDGGACWASVYGVSQSRTQLKWLSSKSLFIESLVAKECSNYHTIALISHNSKVMLKILKVWLQQYMNCELPDVQAGFRKSGGTRDQIANICWIIEKAKEFQKNIYFCFIDYAKSLWLCGSQSTVENSERDGNTRPPDMPLEKPVCRSGSNS